MSASGTKLKLVLIELVSLLTPYRPDGLLCVFYSARLLLVGLLGA